jgi:uncharacterized protein Veg
LIVAASADLHSGMGMQFDLCKLGSVAFSKRSFAGRCSGYITGGSACTRQVGRIENMRESKFQLSDTIKRIEMLRGISILLKINKGRNRFVTFTGKIKDLYPSVFTFECPDDDVPLQTFSYSDVLTKNVRIFNAARNGAVVSD